MILVSNPTFRAGGYVIMMHMFVLPGRCLWKVLRCTSVFSCALNTAVSDFTV